MPPHSPKGVSPMTENVENETKKVHAVINRALHHWLKVEAAKQGLTLAETVAALLAEAKARREQGNRESPSS